MNTIMLWAAAGVSGLTFVVHTFVGGVAVARPLLADKSLPLPSKWLNYYCWHITTVLLLTMSAGFSYAAWAGRGYELVVFLGASSAAFSMLSAVIAIKAGINPLRFPSTSLFAGVALNTVLAFAM